MTAATTVFPLGTLHFLPPELIGEVLRYCNPRTYSRFTLDLLEQLSDHHLPYLSLNRQTDVGQRLRALSTVQRRAIRYLHIDLTLKPASGYESLFTNIQEHVVNLAVLSFELSGDDNPGCLAAVLKRIRQLLSSRILLDVKLLGYRASKSDLDQLNKVAVGRIRCFCWIHPNLDLMQPLLESILVPYQSPSPSGRQRDLIDSQLATFPVSPQLEFSSADLFSAMEAAAANSGQTVAEMLVNAPQGWLAPAAVEAAASAAALSITTSQLPSTIFTPAGSIVFGNLAVHSGLAFSKLLSGSNSVGSSPSPRLHRESNTSSHHHQQQQQLQQLQQQSEPNTSISNSTLRTPLGPSLASSIKSALTWLQHPNSRRNNSSINYPLIHSCCNSDPCSTSTSDFEPLNRQLHHQSQSQQQQQQQRSATSPLQSPRRGKWLQLRSFRLAYEEMLSHDRLHMLTHSSSNLSNLNIHFDADEEDPAMCHRICEAARLEFTRTYWPSLRFLALHRLPLDDETICALAAVCPNLFDVTLFLAFDSKTELRTFFLTMRRVQMVYLNVGIMKLEHMKSVFGELHKSITGGDYDSSKRKPIESIKELTIKFNSSEEEGYPARRAYGNTLRSMFAPALTVVSL
ncbi:hypothetical protein GQ42DRAFT_24412 [Ramicandelaber brevisporus]|nr:hypothetical protein GQ42DRAFT_24412 [Ramicandelaber brevisporus]